MVLDTVGYRHPPGREQTHMLGHPKGNGRGKGKGRGMGNDKEGVGVRGNGKVRAMIRKV